MMRFEIQVNEEPITKVSVINKGLAHAPEGLRDEGDWRVYEWNAWRVNPNDLKGIQHYAAGELVHRRLDGIEELAIKVLQEYRRVAYPEILAGGW
jgi:hypothetical protein